MTMRSAELSIGRVFVLRLQEGEVLHKEVESFCSENGVSRALVTAVGGAAEGSLYVSGPEVPLGDGISPVVCRLDAPHELTGTGTVFPDADGNPMMHMHGSFGREGVSHTGCFRKHVVAWLVLEVTVVELLGDGPVRKVSDPRIDAEILEIG